MTPLTRRDRHAMLLALDCLRASPRQITGRVEDALLAGGLFARELHEAIDRVKRWEPVHHAKLALALRALLRADRGDYGRVMGRACSRCRVFCPRLPPPKQAHYTMRHAPTCPSYPDRGYVSHSSRRVTPWWQQPDVPATGTAARPAGLRRRGGLQ